MDDQLDHIDYRPTAEVAFEHIVFDASYSTVPLGGARLAPVAIPADEVGYWTLLWRAETADSKRARDAGDYRVFDDPGDSLDVVRWLLSDDD